MYSSKHSHNKKQQPQPKCTTKRLTEEQVRLLEASFKLDRKLDTDRKFHLAQELGIPARQVAIWYQNKRARWKSQSLEMGYTALQEKLESTLNENVKLEKEVQRLNQELENVRQMLLTSTNNSSSITYACDEEGSSGLIIGEPHNCSLQNELLACLIGSNNQGHL